MNEDLINRITYYLSSGGLFNPELADHLAVRNLLMECRDTLAQRTWVPLTEQEIGELYRAGFSNNTDFARAVEARLKEKNDRPATN